jgi:hypothetical protein
MSEFVQVLRLDSKYRVSGTGSQFEVELADNLQCGPSTVCHVAAVSFPVSMMTIEEGINDRFYHRIYIDNGTHCTWLVIPAAFYDGPTFATTLQALLNTQSHVGWPAWTVEWNPGKGDLSIQWGADPAPDRSWEIVSEDALMNRSWDWTGPPYDITNPMTCANVLRIEAEPTFIMENEVYTTGVFDAMADYHVVYLHSNLTNFRSSGPRQADRDVIARIPITVGYGSTNHWQPTGSPHEFFPVYGVSLKNIRFSLTDVKGIPLSLHGGNLSIELYFNDFVGPI